MAQKKNIKDIMKIVAELTKENIREELPAILEDIPVGGRILKILSNVALGTIDSMNEEEPGAPALETVTRETLIKEKETIVEEIRTHEFTETEIGQIKQICYSGVPSAQKRLVYYNGFIIYAQIWDMSPGLQEFYRNILSEEEDYSYDEQKYQDAMDEVCGFRNQYIDYADVTANSIALAMTWDGYDSTDMPELSLAAEERSMEEKIVAFIHSLNMLAEAKDGVFPMFTEYTVY